MANPYIHANFLSYGSAVATSITIDIIAATNKILKIKSSNAYNSN